MLLANCVRRIYKINIAKCVNRTITTSEQRCVAVASSTKNPVIFANTSLPNLTSTSLFTTASKRCITDRSWCSQRFYSNKTQDKNKKNDDKKDDTDDLDLDNWNRKLPRFEGDYFTSSSIYLWLKNAFSIFFIRSYFDNQFNKPEFLNGASQAVVVVSNLLASGNFEGLQDMVDDDTIAKMQRTVGPMTPEQRQLIVVNDDDIQWIFPREIQFITKENVDEQKSRFFVEILVVVHAYRGEIEWQDLIANKEKDVMARLENNYSIANYRFIKEFTKGVEDDWTINYIMHIKPSDEMKEKLKTVKEL